MALRARSQGLPIRVRGLRRGARARWAGAFMALAASALGRLHPWPAPTAPPNRVGRPAPKWASSQGSSAGATTRRASRPVRRRSRDGRRDSATQMRCWDSARSCGDATDFRRDRSYRHARHELIDRRARNDPPFSPMRAHECDPRAGDPGPPVAGGDGEGRLPCAVCNSDEDTSARSPTGAKRTSGGRDAPERRPAT